MFTLYNWKLKLLRRGTGDRLFIDVYFSITTMNIVFRNSIKSDDTNDADSAGGSVDASCARE